MAIKIAFSGTHGTGKTTAVKRLSEALKALKLSVGVSYEVTRSCPLPVNELGTGAAQIWIMMNQIANEAYLEGSGCQVQILDRCVFDHIAYARWLHQRGRVALQELSFIEEVARQWARMKPYTVIAILKAKDPPEGDGFRSTDRAFQLEVQDELLRFYREINFRDYFIELVVNLEDIDLTADMLQKYVLHRLSKAGNGGGDQHRI